MSLDPIPLLTDADLQLVEEPPEFESLAAEMLGNAGSEQDGFDPAFAEAAFAVAAIGPALDAGDPDLADAITQVPDLNTDIESPLLEQLAPNIEATDSALDALGAITPDNPPDPPPVTPTPVTGGGGGGGPELRFDWPLIEDGISPGDYMWWLTYNE